MAKTSAFGGAKKTATGASKPSPAPIFVAEDLKDPVTGEVVITRAEVVDAINDRARGKSMMDRGEALITNSEPVLHRAARTWFARLWAKEGVRPENPKITTNAKSEGTIISVSFNDKEINLTDDEYRELVEVIGPENAKRATVRLKAFSFNDKMLYADLPELEKVPDLNEDGLEVAVGPDGTERALQDGDAPPKGWTVKMRSQRYFDVVEAALGGKFEELFGENAGTKIEGLLVEKQVFKTAKGTIDRLLDFVRKEKDGKAAQDVEQQLLKALKAAKIVMQLRPGGSPPADKPDLSALSDADLLAELERRKVAAE